jgi:hypothetical protein
MKYSDKTVLELKEIAKEKGLKGYSKLTKDNLIELIRSKPKKNIQKGGVTIKSLDSCNKRSNYNNNNCYNIDTTDVNSLKKICKQLIETRKSCEEDMNRIINNIIITKKKYATSNITAYCKEKKQEPSDCSKIIKWESEYDNLKRACYRQRDHLNRILRNIDDENIAEEIRNMFDNNFSKYEYPSPHAGVLISSRKETLMSEKNNIASKPLIDVSQEQYCTKYHPIKETPGKYFGTNKNEEEYKLCKNTQLTSDKICSNVGNTNNMCAESTKRENAKKIKLRNINNKLKKII